MIEVMGNRYSIDAGGVRLADRTPALLGTDITPEAENAGSSPAHLPSLDANVDRSEGL